MKSAEQWGQCTTLNWTDSCGDSSLQMYLVISITYSLSTQVSGYWCLVDFKATPTIRLHGRGGVCLTMTVRNSTGRTATITLHYQTLVLLTSLLPPQGHLPHWVRHESDWLEQRGRHHSQGHELPLHRLAPPRLHSEISQGNLHIRLQVGPGTWGREGNVYSYLLEDLQ